MHGDSLLQDQAQEISRSSSLPRARIRLKTIDNRQGCSSYLLWKVTFHARQRGVSHVFLVSDGLLMSSLLVFEMADVLLTIHDVFYNG